jgi:glycosyl transferase family 2
MTLLVRDEADTVAACIRHHLDSGVDFVVATDHGSVDGTSDILRSFERGGRLRVIRVEGTMSQAEWVTRMARLAASEHQADWVINVDADEFWWPRRGSIREVLAAIPERYGVVRGLMRHFAPRPTGPGPFYERMFVRHACDPDPYALFHSQVKIAHRGLPDVVVSRGSHDAFGDRLMVLREWLPFEVLHFPVRTVAQMRAKYSRRTDPPAPFVQTMRAGIAARGVESVFESLCVTDDRLRSEIERGSLSVDLRLRAALADHGAPAPALPPGVAPESPHDADRSFVADVAAFMETDSALVLEQRLGEFERSLGFMGRRQAPRTSLRRLASSALRTLR